MTYSAAVITISDKGSQGLRKDTSGPALQTILKREGYDIIFNSIIPDEAEKIKAELIKCADELKTALILTTGGTGFSPRDITPEATLSVVERETRGIPELMRMESMKITPRGCLSRAAAGIRGKSLIINLPGSEKAATECLESVLPPITHGLEMLCGAPTDCGTAPVKIIAVCISEHKGEQKHPVDVIELLPNHGIVGDAHAGNWHRQISLLGKESVDTIQPKIKVKLNPGAFAENILTQGICLYKLPVGTKMRLGTALCEVTQIGKECHNDCAIRKIAGDCVMPREGIFVKVLEPGKVKAGDNLVIIPA